MAEPSNTGAGATPLVPEIGIEADEWANDSALRKTDGLYSFPNDERENDRLDLQHALFLKTLGGKLFSAPIPSEQQLHRVLDVGTGTGIWAIDFADEHPESEVIGIDLSATQPKFVPPNLTFEIDDLEDNWTFTKPFDLIFGRMTVGAFADSKKFFEQAYQNLTPGGWVECLDICNPVKSDDGTLPEDCDLLKWSQFMLEGCKRIGRSAESPRLYKAQLEELGYINVQEVVYKWPINRWPKGKKFKELGSWALANVEPNIEGLSMAIFTRVLGWSQEDLLVFLTGVRKDLKNLKFHVYWEIYNVLGQKPPASSAGDQGDVGIITN